MKDFGKYVYDDLAVARANCSGRDRVYKVTLDGRAWYVVGHSPERVIACAARAAGAKAELAEPTVLSESGEARVAAVHAALMQLDERTRQVLFDALVPKKAD